MSLLAPLAGLIAGVLGLTGILALHALKLRREPMRVSSTLLWKDAAQDLEVNTPIRRPRMTLMLLLQALAILFLALAIARPVYGDVNLPAGRVVIVIDATASMRALTETGGTRFDAITQRAEERLKALRRSDRPPEIAVVRFALTPKLVAPPTRSIGDALAALRSIEPSDQPGDVQQLRELLASLDGEGTARQRDEIAETPPGSEAPSLWIYTDGGSIDERDLVGRRGEINIPALVGPDNLGIAALHASRDPDQPDKARVFLRVVSNADRPVGIVVRADSGTGSVRIPLEVPASEPGAPGSVTRSVEIEAPGAQRVKVSLDHQARADALASDDTAWVDVPDPSPPRTVVYAPNARPDPFLMDVIDALAPNHYSTHTPGDLEALRGAELVIYDRTTPVVPPPVPSLGFGSAWPVGSPNPDPPMREQRERIVAWERAHPVLRSVTLAPVIFDRAVSLPDGSDPSVRVLAESADGPVITETVAGGNRHLRVAFPLARSNWSVEVGMSIFLAASFERLVPGTRGEGVVVTTSKSFEVTANAPRIEAAGPATLSAPATQRGVAALGPAPRVGVYRLTGAVRTEVAVSMLNAAESALRIGEPAVFGDPHSESTAAGDGAGRRELWPIGLLVALALMTAEFLVHAARARI
ncbi:MAG: VWA domain-containing protein [Planctomycetota bacterium]